ncbi:hypothetical protein IAD21_06208 [Abditibacteriota bacterium]|nr:hypothetical protein IAD21_06208 [Abditibacteriota bacterium]
MTQFIKTASRFAVALALLALPLRAHAQELSSELQGLLQAPYQPQPLWFASTDPKHQNFDYVLLQPGQTRRIPLAKGNLLRLWSTSLFPDQTTLQLQTNRDRVTPLWANGKALSGTLQNKAYTLFPIFDYEALSKLGDGAALIVTNRAKQPSKWYFQASVRPDKQVELPILPQVTAIDKREFTVSLPKNSEREFGSWANPGLIYELTIAMDSGSAKGIFSQLRLRATWDGQRAVDAPLLALAGQERGDEFGGNSVADYDGYRLLLRWPMPFKTAKLSLYNPTNQDLKLDVMARVQSFAEEPSKVRFCAIEQSAHTETGKPISILKAKGQGTLAGLALSIEPDKGSPKQTFGYLEGNETITIDGAPYEGTGNEDYFSSAWYFPDKPYIDQYNGLSFKSARPPTISAYRFHVVDPLPFKQNLDFSFEQGRGNNTNDLNWKWTAFWYQVPPLSVPGASGGSAPDGTSPLTPESAPGGLSNGLKIALAVFAGIAIGVFSALRKIKRKRV